MASKCPTDRDIVACFLTMNIRDILITNPGDKLIEQIGYAGLGKALGRQQADAANLAR